MMGTINSEICLHWAAPAWKHNSKVEQNLFVERSVKILPESARVYFHTWGRMAEKVISNHDYLHEIKVLLSQPLPVAFYFMKVFQQLVHNLQGFCATPRVQNVRL